METNFIESNSCCIEQRKFVEILCTNKKVKDADVDPPKIDCARDFEQLQSLVANISGADQDINKCKQT